MTQRLILCIVILFLHDSSIAQALSDKSYFLRHSLIFFADETPLVTRSNIVFTKRSICGFSPTAYKSPILLRGNQVRILSVDRDQDPAHIVFTDSKREYHIDLANASKLEFKRSSDLAFSDKKREFGFGNVRNPAAAIKEYGFPVAKCADDGGWFYFVEFSPVACGSFDGCVINFTKKGLSLYGYV